MSGHFPMNVGQHNAVSQRPQGSTQCLQSTIAEDGAMDVDVARFNLSSAAPVHAHHIDKVGVLGKLRRITQPCRDCSSCHSGLSRC